MDVADLEVLRLILQGGSVIDWRRLHFRDVAEVDRFLRLHLFDLGDPRDEARVRAILAQAVEYLRTAYGYRVAAAVAQPEDLRTLFLLASGVAEPSRYRRIACVVLKVMHVVHHVEARELLFRAPMREADLADRVERRVMAVAGRMAEAGLPVVEFQGNRKSRDSLVTKLSSPLLPSHPGPLPLGGGEGERPARRCFLLSAPPSWPQFACSLWPHKPPAPSPTTAPSPTARTNCASCPASASLFSRCMARRANWIL